MSTQLPWFSKRKSIEFVCIPNVLMFKEKEREEREEWPRDEMQSSLTHFKRRNMTNMTTTTISTVMSEW